MNGVHDMGGLQDMGPVHYEKNEPAFHSPWEGRVFGLNVSLRALGKWNLDAWRYQIELLPPADYLRLTYYEKWLEINEQLAVKHGLVTRHELETGVPDPRAPKATPALTVAIAAVRFDRGIPSAIDPTVPPRFQLGQHVRARNINPTGHTRLPRYARGKAGVIAIDHGVYTFSDTNAHFQGEQRQHVYSVRFAARELWGEQASPRDSVHLDLFDAYLEPS
jgi:nitrile hydratase beta subunit